MTYANRQSVKHYTDIGLQTQVLGASPTQLIALLMDGALAAIRKARLFMQAGNIQGRGASISKAIEIVESGLKASVKRGAGKTADSLADNLITTYDAIVHHLLQANLSAGDALDKSSGQALVQSIPSLERLDLAEQLLGNIRQAWQEATGAADAAS